MTGRLSWWRAMVVAVVLAALLAGSACSGGDDEASRTDDSEQDEGGERDEAAQAPATTAEPREEPPGTEPEEVRPYIQELLRRFDEVTAQIMADPEIAKNRDHSLYGELRELLTPDSAMTDLLVTTLMEQGLRGESQRPFDGSGPPVRREVAGDVTTESVNAVTFPMCAYPNYRLFNSAGQETEYSTGPSLLARGTAARVNGRWLISRIDSLDDRETCATRSS